MIFNLGLFADCSSGSPGEIGVRRSSVTKEGIPGVGWEWDCKVLWLAVTLDT